MIDEAKDASESDDSDIAEVQGFDKWPREVAIAFDQALGVIALKSINDRKNGKLDFASVVADFRALEAEYLERLGDNAENALQVRRIITENLMTTAYMLDQPFETCLHYWNDLQQFGFYRIERRCLKTGVFVACCREHGQTDMGIALLDPLITELERLRADPSIAQFTAEYYDEEIESLGKLRAKLEAQRE